MNLWVHDDDTHDRCDDDDDEFDDDVDDREQQLAYARERSLERGFRVGGAWCGFVVSSYIQVNMWYPHTVRVRT